MSQSREGVGRYGQAVKRVLDDHKATYRSQRARTGLPHSTVVNWVQGVPPTMEGVVAFARGFDEDVNEWLKLAGFPTLPPRGSDVLISGLFELQQQNPGKRVPIPHLSAPPEELSVAEAQDLLMWAKGLMEEEARERENQYAPEIETEDATMTRKTEQGANVARMGRR
jgi:hypothetical protein